MGQLKVRQLRLLEIRQFGEAKAAENKTAGVAEADAQKEAEAKVEADAQKAAEDFQNAEWLALPAKRAMIDLGAAFSYSSRL